MTGPGDGAPVRGVRRQLAEQVTVIGGGLAGSEAAWQVARRLESESQAGARVVLYEMRPVRQTPVHESGLLAELVCSNSFRSDSLDRAGGVLKAELRRLGSLVIACADEARVPAGTALAVDRERFARLVTERVEGHERIEVRREEVTELPDEGPAIIATGPLTSSGLAKALYAVTGEKYLFFYDAVSPIVAAESVDMAHAFFASRYAKGEGEYLNCPLSEEEYDQFYRDLVTAERAEPHEFEKDELFEACLPVEVIAERGVDALRYGPMKPVGLVDPRTEQTPYAVVQLRPETVERTMYNLVGFQTALKWGEQKRVFRRIPALQHAEFLRFGVVHRNTYINAPALLDQYGRLKQRPHLFFAGQLTGVEGYVEAAASGLVAGINAYRGLRGREPVCFPRETMLGSLAHYLATADKRHFQPMNANFGLLPPIERTRGQRKKEHKLAYGQRALEALEGFLAADMECGIP